MPDAPTRAALAERLTQDAERLSLVAQTTWPRLAPDLLEAAAALLREPSEVYNWRCQYCGQFSEHHITRPPQSTDEEVAAELCRAGFTNEGARRLMERYQRAVRAAEQRAGGNSGNV